MGQPRSGPTGDSPGCVAYANYHAETIADPHPHATDLHAHSYSHTDRPTGYLDPDATPHNTCAPIEISWESNGITLGNGKHRRCFSPGSRMVRQGQEKGVAR